MEKGIPISQQVTQVSVAKPYKLVISSPGGHPKDINVYQSQKALASAVKITQPGGSIILTAACPEGSGSLHYEEWISDKKNYNEVLSAFQREGFRIGPHKAFQFARDTAEIKLFFYSDMENELAEALLLNPVKYFQEALDAAISGLHAQDRVAVLPHATSTIPYLHKDTPQTQRYQS
jgi:nickel-dependent lactate racemase